jgi:sporulation protein YlmC with PRC-barrel domain
MGKKVVASDGYVLGEVEGVEVDTEKWSVTNLRVTLTKQAVEDLKLEPPILWDVVISLSTKNIKAYGEPITLNVPFLEIATLAKPKAQ